MFFSTYNLHSHKFKAERGPSQNGQMIFIMRGVSKTRSFKIDNRISHLLQTFHNYGTFCPSIGHKDIFFSCIGQVVKGLYTFTEEEYLHLGWTCLTVVLMDCVRWPPGQSHIGLDSKLFLQVMQLLSFHRLSWDAVHVFTHTHTNKSSERNIHDI